MLYYPNNSHRPSPFENDLLTDLIPFIEKTYSAKTDRESRHCQPVDGRRASSQLWAQQPLHFRLDRCFSSAPNTKPPADLIKDPAEAAMKLRLLYVACGDQDRLFRISEGVHNMLDEKKVPHVYRVISGGRHDFKVWKSDLYHFAQLLFREPG